MQKADVEMANRGSGPARALGAVEALDVLYSSVTAELRGQTMRGDVVRIRDGVYVCIVAVFLLSLSIRYNAVVLAGAILYLCAISVSMALRYRQSTVSFSYIHRNVALFLDRVDDLRNRVSKGLTMRMQSPGGITVHRDGVWKQLPCNLCIPGDRVRALPRDPVLGSPSVKLRKDGDEYILLNCPAVDHIAALFARQETRQRQSPLRRTMGDVVHALEMTALGGFLLCIIIGLIRTIEHGGAGSWTIDVMYLPFVVAAALVSPASDIALLLLDLSTAWLFFRRIGSTRSRFIDVLHDFCLNCLDPSLPLFPNPVDALGSISALGFLDRQGLLSDTFALPEMVVSVDGDSPAVIECTAKSRRQVERSDDAVFVPLERNDHSDVELEKDWSQHTSSLNPLGLSSLLRPACLSGQATVEIGCLCLVGRQLGYSASQVRSQYRIRHTATSTLTSRDSNDRLQTKTMLSSVVQVQHTPILQLFSRGSPSLVIEHCGYVWNGSQVARLPTLLRHRLLSIARRWIHDDMAVYALAYSPVPPQHTSLFDLKGLPTELDLNELEAEHEPASSASEDGSSSSSEDDVRRREAVRRRFRQESWTAADVPLQRAEDVGGTLARLQSGQILLGLVATRQEPRNEIPDVVQLLDTAGIRFIHFSTLNKRKSVAFASKLGLDTDWNFYISLQDPHHDGFIASPVNQAKNISKMPVGVSNIRSHIENVDNVPLLLSLFTDTTPETVAEMIRILQEYNETVGCLGSDLSAINMDIFLEAHVSIAAEPTPFQRSCFLHGNNNIAGFNFTEETSRVLTRIPCALRLQKKRDVYQSLRHSLNEARRILEVMHLLLHSYAGAGLCMFLAAAVSFVTGAGAILELYHVLWLSLVQLPLLSSAVLYARHTDSFMTRTPEKYEPYSITSRTTHNILLRYAPTALLYVIVFLVQLGIQDDVVTAAWFDTASQPYTSRNASIRLLQAQNYALWALVLWLCVHTACFLHRRDSVWASKPWASRSWLLAVGTALVLQSLFCLFHILVLLSSASQSKVFFPNTSVLLLVFLWPCGILVTDELVKRRDRRFFSRQQRRLRIEFDTKLGMHSPK